MKKFLGFVVLSLLIFSFPQKSSTEEVKDCFEGLNRATFALNRGLDKIIIEPLAKGYRKLPVPIRTGTSNMLSNLSNLITIPNNILQGDFKSAGLNTARLSVNTTIGIFGIFDVAQQMGLIKSSKEDYGFTYKTDKLINLKNGKSQNIKDYSGKVFHLILTIADSYFVEEVLKDNNIKYISHFYPDHFNINDTMLEFDDNYDILLTEKELVKITNMENTKIFYIPTEISVDEKIQNDINLKLNY